MSTFLFVCTRVFVASVWYLFIHISSLLDGDMGNIYITLEVSLL